jgi:DNA polymerase
MPVVALAFGATVAQKITGERDPLPQLRETVFALNTGNDQEIPVIASFDLTQVIAKSRDKALLWQDLLLAKSVLQNS